MKIAYIFSVLIWQLSVLAGSAYMAYIMNNGWWILGGVVMCSLSGASFSIRMDKWGDK